MSLEIAATAESEVLEETGPGSSGQGETSGEGPFARCVRTHLNFIVFAVIAAGFLARAYVAATTYLNPDEALHYIIFNQTSALFAYKISLTNAHPPLIYLLLYYWSILGRSELMLRLPSVLAGTGFCWMVYKWIGSLFGKAAGIFALILVAFLPVMIALSAEIRSYALLLFCETTALYLIEQALNNKSVKQMRFFTVFLYLAILSHYSAVFFVAALGFYSAARLLESKFPRAVVRAWVLSQCGALTIYWFLYETHISRLKNYIKGWQVSFDQNYSHTNHQHFFTYARERTIDIFLFLFENQYLVLGILLLWMVSIAVLFLSEWKFPGIHLRTRFTGSLLVLPMIGVFTAGLLGYYPYVGSRHTIFLAPFLIAGLSSFVEMIDGRKLWATILIAALLVGAAYSGGSLSEPYLTRENQSSDLMNASLKYIRETIPQGEPIVTDYQSALMYVYYLCGPKLILPVGAFNLPSSRVKCNGYTIASFPAWGMEAPFFLSEFSKIAHAQRLISGQRVWVVQSGWRIALSQELTFNMPQFRCLHPKNFGANISIFPLQVNSDFSPVATSTNCSNDTPK